MSENNKEEIINNSIITEGVTPRIRYVMEIAIWMACMSDMGTKFSLYVHDNMTNQPEIGMFRVNTDKLKNTNFWTIYFESPEKVELIFTAGMFTSILLLLAQLNIPIEKVPKPTIKGEYFWFNFTIENPSIVAAFRHTFSADSVQ